jgi:nitrogen regulatory protein P-II 1
VKQVLAIVKPFLAERVLDRLKLAPLEALSVREVKGYGRQKSYLDEYGDSEFSMAFLPKVEIAMWVDDARVEEIVRKIVEVARTGRIGDGKVFIIPTAEHSRVIDIGESR